MPEWHILWTLVTSPLIGPDIYNQIVNTYLEKIDINVSLVTVTKLQKLIWNVTEPKTTSILLKNILKHNHLNQYEK